MAWRAGDVLGKGIVTHEEVHSDKGVVQPFRAYRCYKLLKAIKYYSMMLVMAPVSAPCTNLANFAKTPVV